MRYLKAEERERVGKAEWGNLRRELYEGAYVRRFSNIV